MQAGQSVSSYQQRARGNARLPLLGLLMALCAMGTAQAADQAEDTDSVDLEGTAAVLDPGQTAPLEQNAPLQGMGELTTGRKATWLLPAQYARSIDGVSVLQVRPDLYMLTVGGRNVAVETGWQGTLVIGGAAAEDCDALLTAVKAIARAPIRNIVNTSADAERVGCNGKLAEAGRAFTAGVLGFAAPVIAHQNALLQLISGDKQYAPNELPSELFTRPVRNMYLNDQGVQIFWMPKAHTNADTMVLFRRSDVVVAGDILDETSFPVISLARGGSIDGEVAALNRLLDEFSVAVYPRVQRPGGTVVIPGRGELCVPSDLLAYRDMVTIVRDRVKALVDRGASLAQVQKSDPTRGFDTRYGKKSGNWTSEDFVAAIYQSLQAERGAKR
jgi:glyoxylase-like metal-dependent hydrolase (beta-lactamase superfamily II)